MPKAGLEISSNLASCEATCFSTYGLVGWICSATCKSTTSFDTKMQANMDSDLQERIWSYVSRRQQLLQQRQLTGQEVQECLEDFLSWLLDARWFPETDSTEMRRRKAELKKLRALLARMEAFSKDKRDMRLQRGLAEWRSYLETLEVLAKQHVRRAPDMQTSEVSWAEIEVAERLLCATLIIPKLWPGTSVYGKMQKLLAEPATLPRPITAAEDSKKELRGADGGRVYTPLQAYFIETGKEMPLRPYLKSEKTLQSCVGRLLKKIEAGSHFSRHDLLKKLYGQYLWSQWGRAGFSQGEAQMLRSLLPPESGSDGAAS
jgi:hypothetical protein